VKRIGVLFLIVTVVLLTPFIFTDIAHGSLNVYIVPQSVLVHKSDLTNALPAFQAAVSEDFAPLWGQDAHLIVTDTPPSKGWAVLVQDYSDVFGALGYHGLKGDIPFSKVFAADTVGYGETWQGCLTHELFEMLADPYIDRLTLSTRLWLVEVADPVEADAFNYTRTALDGSLVPISDFVTPAWYHKGAHKVYDFKRHVRKPFQILHRGYASYWENNAWHQLVG